MKSKIEETKARIEELEELISGSYAADVAEEYDIRGKTKWQIEDIASEFANNNLNIYDYDILEYYEAHKVEASNALQEMGFELGQFDTLEDAIKEGSLLAQYKEIYDDIMSYIDELEELGELREYLEELEEEEE